MCEKCITLLLRNNNHYRHNRRRLYVSFLAQSTPRNLFRCYDNYDDSFNDIFYGEQTKVDTNAGMRNAEHTEKKCSFTLFNYYNEIALQNRFIHNFDYVVFLKNSYLCKN